MAWPPPVFPINFANTTPQQDEHPDIHNEVNASLNNDFRPRIDQNRALIDGNAADISDVADDLATHIDSAVRTDLFLRLEQQVNNTITHFGEWPITVRQFHGQVAVRQTDSMPTSLFPFSPGGVTALAWLRWQIVNAAGDIALRPRSRQVVGHLTFLEDGTQTNYVAAMIRRSDTNSNLYIADDATGDSKQRTIGSRVTDPSPLATNFGNVWINMLWQLDA